MSSSLIFLVSAVALVSVVVAAIVSKRRLRDAGIEVERTVPLWQPEVITTFEYDATGAVISAKTNPAKPLDDPSSRALR